MTRETKFGAEAKRIKSAVSIATVVGETLRLQRDGRYLVALCPFHAEQTPSFHVYPDHYHCFGCGAHGDVFAWLKTARRMSFREAVRHLAGWPLPAERLYQRPGAPKALQPNRSPTANMFLRCWDQGVDPAGTIVETYLRNRGGLTIPEGAPIRFHPRCQRGPSALPSAPEHWPAMLALMTDPITGVPVGLHRTFLLPDGSDKAPVTSHGKTVLKSKMVMGTWGVVRLAPDQDVGRALAVAEGVENALTAMQVIGWGPVWSAGNQDGIRQFPLLPTIEALTIFADADDTGVGLCAARACADRWVDAGREARIYVPRGGEDWNDAVQRVTSNESV